MKEMDKVRITFLCVGFPKCGTTTLHDVLCQHEDIFLPLEKETIFFSKNVKYKKKIDWYYSRFYEEWKGQNAVGAIEPVYYDCAEQIYNELGSDVRILIMLRNPVSRLWSDYKSWLRWGRSYKPEPIFKYFKGARIKKKNIVQDFEILVDHILKNNEVRDEYIKCIRDYKRFFNNIMVVNFEELLLDPQRKYEQIFDFLGVDKAHYIDVDVMSNQAMITSGYSFWSYFVNRMMYYYSYIWMKQVLLSWWQRLLRYRCVEKVFEKTMIVCDQKIPETCRKKLAEYFAGVGTEIAEETGEVSFLQWEE